MQKAQPLLQVFYCEEPWAGLLSYRLCNKEFTPCK